MNPLLFRIPPLPHYIASGFNRYPPGYHHPNRQHIKVFDLLVVLQGCLYIGEEERRFMVNAGDALILRPDCHHFGTEGCREDTAYYWLHFQTAHEWPPLPGSGLDSGSSTEPVGGLPASFFNMSAFNLALPQFVTLLQPAKAEELLAQLGQLQATAHLEAVRFRQQVLFQEVLQLLAASVKPGQRGSQSTVCAEQAASYLRAHYREEITTAKLGDSLNFHPVYIARCMNKEYGCSPMEYLLRYRIEQSKLLLMQTGFPIARIAEEVGFNQAPYFSSSFMKLEGLSPREYRQRFT
ncbi:helix-turn-helix domain-containing protein [Paenibacillus sp. MMS20-IR301]|uniref:helix-turn-helix transcriptional regulator n=1 Tax=Paenibacillus sp. MMS20-IR301 TaxID=2895946 RepID=UPI0028ED2FA7|nr:helix-turn-helix domain-containing protein [Paenibacillus sp. MMS20-IR301]WNS43025.1 helix-turn-helix domain-containing protein [Paenibacillus sp. MMS20-IR301]